MKIFVLWAVIIAVSFIVPTNVPTAFVVGSWFGIIWMRWFND
jgi:hypothetical protein